MHFMIILVSLVIIFPQKYSYASSNLAPKLTYQTNEIVSHANVYGRSAQNHILIDARNPVSFEKLPNDTLSLILTFVTHDLGIKERCPLEVVSKKITKLFNSVEGHNEWGLIKLWKVIPVRGVSWRNRWEGFLSFKNFQIERARYEATMTGDLSGEDSDSSQIKRKLLEYLYESCSLRDPYALDEIIMIYYEGRYGYQKDYDAACDISEAEKYLGGTPLSADIMCLDAVGNLTLYKDSMFNGITKRRLRSGIKKSDIKFIELKFQCYLMGKCGYEKNYDAARLFLAKIR